MQGGGRACTHGFSDLREDVADRVGDEDVQQVGGVRIGGHARCDEHAEHTVQERE